MEEMVKTSMTKDEIIMELMELLKQNDRKKQAGEDKVVLIQLVGGITSE